MINEINWVFFMKIFLKIFYLLFSFLLIRIPPAEQPEGAVELV